MSSHRGIGPPIVIGGVGGLAWATSLRGMMAQFAGVDSTFHWFATFGFILVPGTAMGALLGWAFARRRDGRRRGAAVLALAPFVMAADPSTLPLLAAFIGAGFLFSGRSRRWVRLLAGISSLVFLAAVPVGAAVFFADITTPHGAWLILQLASLIAVPAIAEIVLQYAPTHTGEAATSDDEAVHPMADRPRAAG
ncbi:hypothetical protein [Microbacterium panaciterrae]|uniref:Uncharacterized protein n=1 Tax=Microbacterium panaciterrae TaxID=985759 RepID=A0ABP8P6A3_9MICO